MGTYDESAKEWASTVRSGNNLGHTYLEKPAMYKKLPDLSGASVLCVGCGSGEECEYLKARGCSTVVGVDLSAPLIAIATESYPDIKFIVGDMEKFDFPEASFDFVYSSLAMHYKQHWVPTLRAIAKVMKPDATFLFSTHHPLTGAAETVRSTDLKTKILGYRRDGTKAARIYGDYLNARNIRETWSNGLDVSYYHKPFAEILMEIMEAGFEIIDMIEPKAISEARTKDKNFFDIHQRLPACMIFELRLKNTHTTDI